MVKYLLIQLLLIIASFASALPAVAVLEQQQDFNHKYLEESGSDESGSFYYFY